jgi:hypothetical protein
MNHHDANPYLVGSFAPVAHERTDFNIDVLGKISGVERSAVEA